MKTAAAIYARVSTANNGQNPHSQNLTDLVGPLRLFKGTDTSINGAVNGLDLIVQMSRYFIRPTGNLKSFGRSAFDVVSYFRCETDGNCCSDENSNAKCSQRFHDAPPRLGSDIAKPAHNSERGEYMKAAIYARVSTANNGQDPRMQTGELGEFCERRGWTLAEYVDIGISGTKEKRPALDRLMAEAHKSKFDVVVVWKFDRFARSVSHLPGPRDVPGARE